MKKFAGYINQNLNGVLYPSSIQSMMKDYINKKLNGIFYLSPTEILHAKFCNIKNFDFKRNQSLRYSYVIIILSSRKL